MSSVRHIFLGLLFLLVSGGSQTALAFTGATELQAPVGEYAAGHDRAATLEATLPNERCPTGRTGEGRTAPLTPASVWVDPHVPPILSTAPIAADEAEPACRARAFLAPFARAPPVCP